MSPSQYSSAFYSLGWGIACQWLSETLWWDWVFPADAQWVSSPTCLRHGLRHSGCQKRQKWWSGIGSGLIWTMALTRPYTHPMLWSHCRCVWVRYLVSPYSQVEPSRLQVWDYAFQKTHLWCPNPVSFIVSLLHHATRPFIRATLSTYFLCFFQGCFQLWF